MHFPWKKSKISHLVHNSQKRQKGSSLVVETGFPTSLIDLFIKNREKLKKPPKPSKKKRVRHRSNPTNCDANNQLIVQSLPESYASYLPSYSTETVFLPMPLRSRGVNEIVLSSASNNGDDCDDDDDDGDGGDDDDEDAEGSSIDRHGNMRGVLVAIVKIFLVVVLAFGTKKLAVGITLSAFLLFFLEYIGRFSCRLLKPIWVGEESVRLGCSASEKESGLSSSTHDIKNVNPQCFSVPSAEEIHCKEIVHKSSSNGKLNFGEGDSEKEIIENKLSMLEGVEKRERNKGKLKINWKVKKFVSKKMRKSKEQKCEFSETTPMEAVSAAICEEQETDDCERERESEIDSKLSSMSCEKHGTEDFADQSCSSVTLRGEEEPPRNSRCLVLCLIVLVGLIGGRGFALLLTLLWFLMLKQVEKNM